MNNFYKKVFIALTFLVLAGVGRVLGATYYVATAGNGGSNANSGTIGSPFLTLTYALTKATTTGDQIIIGAGTFTADYGMTISHSITINGAGATTIFNPASTTHNFATVSANNVTIENIYIENNVPNSGNGGALDVSGTGLTVSSVTFKSTTANANGGAINLQSTATGANISSCTFTSCQSDNAAAGSGSGGAIYCAATSGTTISGCTFSSCSNPNHAGDLGGAIYASGPITVNSNCSFSSCYSGHQGGAIYLASGSTTSTISSCTFTSNYCSNGGGATDESGGAIYSAVGAVTISSCTFTTNYSYDSGGAISIENTTSGTSSISKCTFNGNYNSSGSSYGAAIYFTSSSTGIVQVLNSLFFGNDNANATNTLAISGGGTTSGTPNVVDNCTFYQSAGGYNIFIENTGIYLNIYNSILWTTTHTSPILNVDASSDGNSGGGTHYVSVAYSMGDFQYASGGNYYYNAGNNVIETTLAAIKFKGATTGYTYAGGFILSPGSPAIAVAATTSNGTYPSQTTDLNSVTRPASPSMGALEFGGCGTYTAGTYYVGGTVGSTVDGHNVDFGNITAVIDTLKQCGWTGNITFQLNTTYTSSAETFPIDFTGLSTSSSKTLTFEPDASANALQITSSNSTGTLLFDGQSYITFNGSPNAANTMDATNNLFIINSNTSGYTIKFVNGCNNDLITYCNIEGENTSTTNGTIWFALGPGGTTGHGNYTNTISYNTIGDVSGNKPTNAIFALGSTKQRDSLITITQNYIYNYFSASSASNGILLSDYNDSWTISNNKFYQTGTITQTSSVIHSGIYITYTSAVGNNFSISGNTIGYAASGGTGTYTFAGNSGSAGSRFLPIYLNVGSTTASSVTSNTITAIAISGAYTSINTALPGTFSGIAIAGGAVTVGGSGSGNTIGGSTGTDLITYYAAGGVNTWYGIYSNSSNAVTISYNTIGGCSNTGAAASSYYEFDGIFALGSGTPTITNNTIGSTTTSNSISVGLSGSSGGHTSTFYGINCISTGTPDIETNTIQNILMYANANTTEIANFYGIYFNATPAAGPSFIKNAVKTVTLGGSGSSFYGIYDAPTGGAYTHTIHSNTIGGTGSNDISVNKLSSSYLLGIKLGYSITTQTYDIKYNTVQNLSAGSSSTGQDIIAGISCGSALGSSNSSGGTALPTLSIIGNTINTLSALSTTAVTSNSNAQSVSGIDLNGAPAGTLDIEQNRIVGLVNSAANQTSAYYNRFNGINGMFLYCAGSTAYTIYNNFIYLTEASNNVVYGIDIYKIGASSAIYYNSIRIDGTETAGSSLTGDVGSNCYVIQSCITTAGTLNIKNNILVNTTTSTNGYYHVTHNPIATGTYTSFTITISNNYGETNAPATRYACIGASLNSTAYTSANWTSQSGVSTETMNSKTISLVSPAGSLSSADLTTVGTGADLHAITGCTYDINNIQGNRVNTGGHNGKGEIGCWEAAGGFYWVGGPGNWSDYTNHWSTATGPQSGSTVYCGSVPSINDNAYFDANSGGGTCTIDGTSNCFNLTATGYTGLFAGTNALNIGGSLTNGNGMGTNTYTGTTTFSGTTTYSITSNGESFLGPVVFNGTGGSWALQDNSTMSGGVTLTAGTLTVGAHTLTLGGTTTVARTSGTIDASSSSAVLAFTNTASFTLPTSLFTSSKIGSVTMNGAGGVTFQEALNITTNLTLTSGVLNIGSNILTLGANGTDMTAVTANTGTSTSWINASNTSGGVKQYVNNNSTTYQFPIGDGTHSTPINFNFTTGTAAGDYLTVYTTQATMPKFNTSISNYLNRYWSVVASGISSPNYAVNYYYNAADIHTSFTKMDPIEQINPATPTYPQWVIPSGTVSNVTAGGSWTPTFTNSSYKLGTATWTSATNAVSWTGITQLPTTAHSLFGGADDQATVLPIELVSFTANPVEKVVLLNWETASELDNAYFTIEKTQDGVNFEKVTQVAGAGNSAEKMYYAAVDSFPFPGLSYYRLKQTDFDGKYTYSNLVPVNFNSADNNEFVLYPNPVNNGLLNLSYLAKKGSNMVVSFYDIQGRLVATQVVPINNTGAQLVNLYPTQGLSSGVYMVKGVSDSMSFVKKVVVE